MKYCMKFKNLAFVAAIASVALVGCENSGSSVSNVRPAVAAEAVAATPPAVAVTAPPAVGTPDYSFDVTGKSLTVDGLPVVTVDASTFAGFPVLASDVAEVDAALKVIHTAQGTLELYDSSGALMMVIDLLPSTGPALLYTRLSSFAVVSMEYMFSASATPKDLASALLTFNFNECETVAAMFGANPAPTPTPTPVPGQGQGQGQQQGGKVQSCKAASVALNLSEIAPPVVPCEKGKSDQCQEQGKDPGQGQGGKK